MMCCDIRLEAVENGYKLTYREERKNERDTYSIPMSSHKEFVYQDNQLPEAVEKLKELKKQMKKY